MVETFVLYNKEGDYELWLDPIVTGNREADHRLALTGQSEVVQFSCSYDQLYFIASWAHLVKRADFEYPNRADRNC